MMRSHHGVNDPCGRQIAGNRHKSGRLHDTRPKAKWSAGCRRGAAARLLAKADDPASLAPVVERRTLTRALNELLIEVKAAAVNPSDVKAATGLMAYAVFPRTPGRDYAGIVIDGPADWIGREVFGSSGDLGIRRDGTHATHLQVETEAVVDKPRNISWEEAAGIGVPFVTAIEGFRRAGMPKQGDTVLVMGVNGKVGQAAVQIASWNGARVIGVVRKSEPYEGHTNGKVEVIDASVSDVAARVRELTDGKGADIVFNTVGDPYFQAAHKSLGLRGRQILIAAVDRIVQFDILEFYRGQHTYWHRAGAVIDRDRDGAAGARPRFRQRASEAVPDFAECDLSAGAGKGRLCRRRRLLARPRHPAAGISHPIPILRFRRGNETIRISIESEGFILSAWRRATASFFVLTADLSTRERYSSRCCSLFELCRLSLPRKGKKPVQGVDNTVVVSGLLIGLAYGAVGLLSGFCLLSSLRGWWADGDSRLVRTYALALGVAIAATQLLAAGGLVDLGKTIYLRRHFPRR
jgi:NADPH:quinone reductase-like Zn-dependent oxidoreductase